MHVLSYPEARAKLKEIMGSVVNDHAPVVIIRKRGEAVVMVSLADWRAIEETFHLLSSRANSARLRAAIRELERGTPSAEEVWDDFFDAPRVELPDPKQPEVQGREGF